MHIYIQVINALRAHTTPIRMLAFNAKGNLLATCSDKGTVVRVFSIPEGDKLATFRRGNYPAVINAMCFNASSTLLALTSQGSSTTHVFSLKRFSPSSSSSSSSASSSVAAAAALSASMAFPSAPSQYRPSMGHPVVFKKKKSTPEALASSALSLIQNSLSPLTKQVKSMMDKPIPIPDLSLPPSLKDVLHSDRDYATITLKGKACASSIGFLGDSTVLVVSTHGYLYTYSIIEDTEALTGHSKTHNYSQGGVPSSRHSQSRSGSITEETTKQISKLTEYAASSLARVGVDVGGKKPGSTARCRLIGEHSLLDKPSEAISIKLSKKTADFILNTSIHNNHMGDSGYHHSHHHDIANTHHHTGDPNNPNNHKNYHHNTQHNHNFNNNFNMATYMTSGSSKDIYTHGSNKSDYRKGSISTNNNTAFPPMNDNNDARHDAGGNHGTHPQNIDIYANHGDYYQRFDGRSHRSQGGPSHHTAEHKTRNSDEYNQHQNQNLNPNYGLYPHPRRDFDFDCSGDGYAYDETREALPNHHHIDSVLDKIADYTQTQSPSSPNDQQRQNYQKQLLQQHRLVHRQQQKHLHQDAKYQ